MTEGFRHLPGKEQWTLSHFTIKFHLYNRARVSQPPQLLLHMLQCVQSLRWQSTLVQQHTMLSLR